MRAAPNHLVTTIRVTVISCQECGHCMGRCGNSRNGSLVRKGRIKRRRFPRHVRSRLWRHVPDTHALAIGPELTRAD